MDAELKLPVKVFFSCDEDGFSVVDGATVRDMFELANIQPMIRFDVGDLNLFEQRPLKVATWSASNAKAGQSCISTSLNSRHASSGLRVSICTWAVWTKPTTARVLLRRGD